MSSPSCSFKNLLHVLPKPSTHWVGDGFQVRPLFGELAFTNTLSPFLMLDYGSPKKFDPTTKRRGVGVHPHRGFETVTIAFQGEVEHGDSLGNKGTIGPGDVQWMTAASGIVHEEYHSNKLAKEGGVLEMVQLWVNLPSVSKMTKPKYQPILASEIPRVDLDIGYVRIIAGSYAGTPGPATTHSPMNIFDVSIKAGHRIQLEVQTDHNCLFFSRQGRISYIDGTEKHTLLETEQVGVVDRVNGSWIRIQAMDADASVMVLSGLPLDEPIAARGPFVMNTQKELQQAMFDYQNGKFVVA